MSERQFQLVRKGDYYGLIVPLSNEELEGLSEVTSTFAVEVAEIYYEELLEASDIVRVSNRSGKSHDLEFTNDKGNRESVEVKGTETDHFFGQHVRANSVNSRMFLTSPEGRILSVIRTGTVNPVVFEFFYPKDYKVSEKETYGFWKVRPTRRTYIRS